MRGWPSLASETGAPQTGDRSARSDCSPPTTIGVAIATTDDPWASIAPLVGRYFRRATYRISTSEPDDRYIPSPAFALCVGALALR
jgi:hypothetical protein